MFKSPQAGGQIGWGISHKIRVNDAGFPVYVDDATIGEWNGKHIPVSLKAANHTVETAVDGAAIFGVLVICENRSVEGVKVGTAEVTGGFVLPVKSGDALAVGDLVVGAGAGEVRKALEADGMNGVGRICTALRVEDGVTYAEIVLK